MVLPIGALGLGALSTAAPAAAGGGGLLSGLTGALSGLGGIASGLTGGGGDAPAGPIDVSSPTSVGPISVNGGKVSVGGFGVDLDEPGGQIVAAVVVLTLGAVLVSVFKKG